MAGGSLAERPRLRRPRRPWLSLHSEGIPCDLGCTLQGTSLGDWLQEQLFERRIVLVTGRLDDAMAAKAVAALLTLDAGGNRSIELHLG